MLRFNPIRVLAKSTYWQTIYARAKELNLKLFNNDSELSPVQVIFLQWLEIYYVIYQDIAMREDFINSEKLDNDVLIDAYLTYKVAKRNKEREERSVKDSPKIDKNSFNKSRIPSLRFVPGEKKV